MKTEKVPERSCQVKDDFRSEASREDQIVAYARVSTNDQDLNLQLDALNEYGCQKIFTDKASGAKDRRKGLDDAMNYLQSGDTLVVWRLDRLGRSVSGLIKTITLLKEKGIGFKSLRDGAIDTTTPSGELIFHIFAALAQFERELIRERTRAGMKAAKARGINGGRKKVIATDPIVLTAKRMHAAGDMSNEDICATLKISNSTLFRYLAMEVSDDE